MTATIAPVPGTVMPGPRVTAEWLCTKCGVTNRKFVPAGTTVAEDKCVTCHTRHVVWPDERPVRWHAQLA